MSCNWAKTALSFCQERPKIIRFYQHNETQKVNILSIMTSLKFLPKTCKSVDYFFYFVKKINAMECFHI